MNTKQRGTFKLSSRLLRDQTDEVAEVFARLKLIPVRAEYLYGLDVIMYEALCDRFEVVEHGQMSPWYTLTVSKDDAGHVTGVEVMKEPNGEPFRSTGWS